MSRTISRSLASAAVATALAATTVGIAVSTAGAATAGPTLSFTISNKGLSLSGPKTFPAGRVDLSLKSTGSEHVVSLVSFKPGFTLKDLVADIAAFGKSYGPNGPTKAGIKHLDDAINHTHLLGGLDAVAGQTLTGSVVLTKAGTYYAYNDSGNLPAQVQTLTVTAPTGPAASVPSAATITAVNGDRFGGAATLPATGTLTFKNVSTQSPHFLDLQHVKIGTTRAQILKSLMSNSNAEPAFARKGSIGTDAVSPGYSETLNYSLPKGEYVELCFFPDPKTGIPHALMGMFRIVYLK